MAPRCSTATASYLLASGPAGQSATDGAVIIGIDDVTAAELASCTVSIDG
ncbi:MAG: hypothetical protein JWN61_429, partial [Pseudonocardiales bacterium]|nr:hypothetical protein [Pseudonocardiales bacterium]